MSFDLRIVAGDLSISNNGDLEILENENKLKQDILKILITPSGGNPFHPWYGSPISKTLIGSSFDYNFISSIAANQVRSSIERVMELQLLQIQSGQHVSASEQIAAINHVAVERNPSDPRYFKVYVNIITKALTNVEASFDVTL